MTTPAGGGVISRDAPELFGVCVVEQAGTADLELPRPAGMPSFGPIGSFLPFGSFVPLFSFDPN